MALLAEGKRKVKYGLDPRNTNWSNDDSKFGQRLMEKMGWEKGKGLGANETGTTDHIKASFKSDTRGLGCSVKQADAWIAHQDDFNDLLKTLNSEHGSEESKETKKEEASHTDGQKRYYGRFARGRVQTLRSTDDLDCIFGKRKGSSAPDSPASQSTSSSDEDTEKSEPQSHGLKTITSTSSVQEYFAQKMAELKARKAQGNSMTTWEVLDEKTDSEESSDKEKVLKNDRVPPVFGAVGFSYDGGVVQNDWKDEDREGDGRVSFNLGDDAKLEDDAVEKKKRKKSKRKSKDKCAEDDNNNDIGESELQEGDLKVIEMEGKKSKKMKATEVSDELTDENESVSKKKKKKRSKSEDVKENSDNAEKDYQVEMQEEKGVSKKKKDKSRTKKVDDVEDIAGVVLDSSGKKRKRKEKSQKEESVEEKADGAEEAKVEKKLRKRKCQEEAAVAENVCEKKRKMSDEAESDKVNEAVNEKRSKKKSKKSKKSSVAEDFYEICDKEEGKKKSKKKAAGDDSSPVSVSGSFGNLSVGKKENRQKKTVRFSLPNDEEVEETESHVSENENGKKEESESLPVSSKKDRKKDKKKRKQKDKEAAGTESLKLEQSEDGEDKNEIDKSVEKMEVSNKAESDNPAVDSKQKKKGGRRKEGAFKGSNFGEIPGYAMKS